MAKDLDVPDEERASLYFLPPPIGGKLVRAELQLRLEKKGFSTAPGEAGRRWLTELGHERRRGRR